MYFNSSTNQEIAYLNKHYKNDWIIHCNPLTGLPRSLYLTLPDFFLWVLIKEMAYRTEDAKNARPVFLKLLTHVPLGHNHKLSVLSFIHSKLKVLKLII